jgi:hypothetical protein
MTTTVATASTLSTADKLRALISSTGDVREFTLQVLVDFLTEQLAVSDNKVTQYAAPNATGFSVSVTDSSQSTWLKITPAAGYAAGTIVLPAVANCADKQEILVTCTQSVSTLTITPNGSTVYGGPTSLSANGHFTLRFDAQDSTWNRVG